MNILIVDDERLAREGLADSVRKAAPGSSIHMFQNGAEALRFAKKFPCAVAFLDICLRDMSGIELGRKLQELNPEVNLIFATGYGEYSLEAHDLFVSGYLIKPITPEKVRRALAHLRYPQPDEHPRLRVRAFGSFEVYCGEHPVQFSYNKAKELLAYLVDRNGAMCSTQELIGILWEDSGGTGKESYFQNIRSSLFSTLREWGCNDVLVRQPKLLGIRPELIDCDYYDYLSGKSQGISAFHLEYMSQYSWSEFTLARLEQCYYSDPDEP